MKQFFFSYSLIILTLCCLPVLPFWDAQAANFSKTPITQDAHETRSIIACDINNDNKLDLIAGNAFLYSNVLYINNGSANPFENITGTAITNDADSTYAMAAGDMDKDGDIDLIAGNFETTNRLYLNNGTKSPFENVAGSDITSDINYTTSLAVGDVNGDNYLDIVVGNVGVNRLYINNKTAQPFEGITGINISNDTDKTYAIKLYDMDNDGDLDVVAGNSGINRLYLNNGSQNPFENVDGNNITSDAFDTESIAIGDINNDNFPDIVCGNAFDVNRLYLNNQTSSPFTGITGINIGSDKNLTESIVLADMNNDQRLDVIAGNWNDSNRLYYNTGKDLFFDYHVNIAQEINHTTAISANDWNNDGDMDIIVGTVGINYFIQWDTIIHVPDDVSSIQEAINFALDGDTVLVKAGIYKEHIKCNGKTITVMAASTLTPTILEGDATGSVITFDNGDQSVFDGFIITNGFSQNGGGIYCENSSPQLINLLIVNNHSKTNGGAILCKNSHPKLINVTISNNFSENGGAVYCIESDITITNSILWQNFPQEIVFDKFTIDGLLTINYSTIKGGKEGVIIKDVSKIVWNNSIDHDPLFLNPFAMNYSLSAGSPCIESGTFDNQNPDNEHDNAPYQDIAGNVRPTPVGSRPDMGAYENTQGLDEIYIVFPPETKTLYVDENKPDAAVPLFWNDTTPGEGQIYLVLLCKEDSCTEPILSDWIEEDNTMDIKLSSLPSSSNTEPVQYFWKVIKFSNEKELVYSGSFYLCANESCQPQDNRRRSFCNGSIFPGLLYGKVIGKQSLKNKHVVWETEICNKTLTGKIGIVGYPYYMRLGRFYRPIFINYRYFKLLTPSIYSAYVSDWREQTLSKYIPVRPFTYGFKYHCFTIIE